MYRSSQTFACVLSEPLDLACSAASLSRHDRPTTDGPTGGAIATSLGRHLFGSATTTPQTRPRRPQHPHQRRDSLSARIAGARRVRWPAAGWAWGLRAAGSIWGEGRPIQLRCEEARCVFTWSHHHDARRACCPPFTLSLTTATRTCTRTIMDSGGCWDGRGRGREAPPPVSSSRQRRRRRRRRRVGVRWRARPPPRRRGQAPQEEAEGQRRRRGRGWRR